MASNGEELIASILRKNNIFFEMEKAIDGLKHDGYALRFDFFLPAKRIAIEWDGEQHYTSIPFFGGRAGLMKQKENDRRKNRYCLARGIKLYRIPYWEYSKIKNLDDIFQNAHLVESQWHNDRLTPPAKNN